MAKATFTTLAAVPQAPSKAAGSKKLRKSIPNVTTLGAIRALQAMLKSAEAAIREETDSLVLDEFLTMAASLKKQPDNFEAHEGTHKMSCEMKKKSVANGLTPEAVTILRKHKVRLGTVGGGVFFNDEYLEDELMVKRIEKALKTANLPEDIVMRAPSKSVVTKETISDAFALPAKVMAEVMPLLTEIAIRPSFDLNDKAAMLNVVENILGLGAKKGRKAA